jgi:hypothetical protein
MKPMLSGGDRLLEPHKGLGCFLTTVKTYAGCLISMAYLRWQIMRKSGNVYDPETERV